VSDSEIVIKLIERLAQLEGRVSELEDLSKTKKKRAAGAQAKPKGAIPGLDHAMLQPYLKDVTKDLQSDLVTLYGGSVEEIQTELLEAVSWIKANPKRAPVSNYGRFFRNWLSRWYEKKRRGVGTNPVIQGIRVVTPEPDQPKELRLPYVPRN